MRKMETLYVLLSCEEVPTVFLMTLKELSMMALTPIRYLSVEFLVEVKILILKILFSDFKWYVLFQGFIF